MATSTLIKRTRLLLGLTQAEMAERLGVDTSTVARYESRKIRPSARISSIIRSMAPERSLPINLIRASNGLKYVFDLSDISSGIAISRGGSVHVGMSEDEAIKHMRHAVLRTPPDDDQIRRLVSTPQVQNATAQWADFDYRGHLTGRWYRCLAVPVYSETALYCEFEEIEEPKGHPSFRLYAD